MVSIPFVLEPITEYLETKFPPLLLALYIAASALIIKSLTWSVSFGDSANPQLVVIRTSTFFILRRNSFLSSTVDINFDEPYGLSGNEIEQKTIELDTLAVNFNEFSSSDIDMGNVPSGFEGFDIHDTCITFNLYSLSSFKEHNYHEY